MFAFPFFSNIFVGIFYNRFLTKLSHMWCYEIMKSCCKRFVKGRGERIRVLRKKFANKSLDTYNMLLNIGCKPVSFFKRNILSFVSNELVEETPLI